MQSDIILRILILASVATLAIGLINDGWEEGWIDGVGILLSVVIIVGGTVVIDYS